MSKDRTSPAERSAAEKLLANGWRPVGDPQLIGCRWIDPTKPNNIDDPHGIYTDVPVTYTDPETGETRAVQVKRDGRHVDVMQKNWDPPVEPYDTETAMRIQAERDYRAAAEAMRVAG